MLSATSEQLRGHIQVWASTVSLHGVAAGGGIHGIMGCKPKIPCLLLVVQGANEGKLLVLSVDLLFAGYGLGHFHQPKDRWKRPLIPFCYARPLRLLVKVLKCGSFFVLGGTGVSKKPK